MTSEKLSERIEIVWGNDGYRDIITWLKEIKALEQERDTLAETLKAIDEARRANLERAIGAETKCDTLKEQLADARRVDQKTVDNWKQLFDDYRAMKERAEVAEAEVKRLTEELAKKSKPTRQEVMNRRFTI